MFHKTACHFAALLLGHKMEYNMRVYIIVE